MRILALLLAALLTLGLCGCGTPPETPPTEETAAAEPVRTEGQVGLALERDAGLDPYACMSSANRLILSLLYEPLFRVSAQFAAEPVLAEDWTVSEDGRTTTVRLRAGERFSDGSALTADDAAASLRRAAQSPIYGSRLRHVTDVRATDGQTVVLTTDTAYACLPLLLDIPIVREMGEAVQPIGSGPYVLEGDAALRRREGKESPLAAENILLIPIESSEGLRSGFRSGGVSLIIGDPNGSAPPVLQEAPNIWSVPTTELLYLGFNLRSEVFSSGSVRSAVSYAIDRGTIVSEELGGFAAATPLLAPPGSPWYVKDAAEAVSYDPARLKNAVEPGTEITFVYNADNSRRRTLVNRIADELTACGLLVTVNALPQKEFLAALKAGSFDLYLGQIRLTPDLDPEPLFRADSGVCFGGLSSLTQLRQICDDARADHGNSAVLADSVLLDGVLCPIAFLENALCVRAEAKDDFRPCIDRPLVG
ncbi:MAG: ABC transporter substrate-binding protein [Oscillospiraceae bacterium]|nr:ABC transporter substrate-binding protein [Oscillospiraceae bacterium]